MMQHTIFHSKVSGKAKVWLIVLAVIAVLIIGFLIVVAMQPADFKISRSTTIAAAPADIFPHVNDFHQWNDWSPWDKMDPTMRQTYGGAASGEGATYGWKGNNQVGEGKMTVVKSQPTALIQIQLDFYSPMKATNTAEFTFKPEAAGTNVTWSMTGKKNFIQKGFCLFFSMDKMVGPQFEKGLAQLKTIAEAPKK